MRQRIKSEEKEIAPSECFKYFLSIFQSSVDIQQDETHKIKFCSKNEEQPLAYYMIEVCP